MGRKTLISGDGKRETVEEPSYELPDDAKVTVEEEKDKNDLVIRRVIRKPVPVITRRRVYRRVILAPDGSEKGVEEKVEEPSYPEKPETEEVESIPTPMLLEDQECTPENVDKEVRKTITIRRK